MLADLWTVFRKEWLEILDQFSRFKRGGWSILLVFFFLGVFVPLQIGAEWAGTSVMYFYWPFMTASMTSTIVSDSVAGERERHTLETLLATRLPDSAILLGKCLAAITYGYAFALTNVVIGLLTVIVAYGDEAVLMSPSRFALLVALIGSSALFVSGLGLVVSLRTATVRQAQQMFGVFFLAATMLPLIGWTLIEEGTQQTILVWMSVAGVEGMGKAASLLMAALGAFLVAWALMRFKRGTRILQD